MPSLKEKAFFFGGIMISDTIISHTKNNYQFGSFRFESGRLLENIAIAYETWGHLNSEGTNAILITHALTGTSHACSGNNNHKKGWWESLIGPGKAIDTREYFVICSNVLGGCSGSSGPSSINNETGRPYGLDFPTVSIRDMVRAQKRLMDFLGVKQLLMITGGSMGGMQALEWAAIYPDFVKSIAPIATPGKAYPQSIAYRKAQRKAIMMDPDWYNGNYYGLATPKQGMELARLIGFITYRTEEEFAEKFGRDHHDSSLFDLKSRFEIESYLEYHGQKLAKWFDPNTYLYLSKAMDLHDLGRGFESFKQGIQQIKAKILMIGIDSDLLFPVHQQKEIFEALKITNSNAYFKEVKSLYGHDAFLVEKEQISLLISNFLQKIVH